MWQSSILKEHQTPALSFNLPRATDAKIVVNWPVGRVTEGIDAHIDDLKAFFTFAPDRIEQTRSDRALTWS